MKRVYSSDASKHGDLTRELSIYELPVMSIKTLISRQQVTTNSDGNIELPFGQFCFRGNYCGRCQYECEARR